MKKRILAVLCACAMMSSLAACGETAEKTVETAKKTTEATAEATAVASAEVTESKAGEVSYPVTVTDSEGSEVVIESEPQRIISVAPNITETMYQLGQEDKLAGRTDYCDYPEQVQEVPSIGTLTEPDIEKIISLDPDLVIASTHFTAEAEAKLKDLGIKVVVLYEENEVEGVYSILQTIGTICNAETEAAKAVDEMKVSIQETEDKIKDLDRPSVYYVVGYGEYGDYTAGGDTFVGQLMERAGGSNIAKDVSGWSYTLESLVEADPDIIILPQDMKEDFMAADNYKDLTAVKDGKVFGVDNNTIERQGYRNAEGLRSLAEIIHPEAFQ